MFRDSDDGTQKHLFPKRPSWAFLAILMFLAFDFTALALNSWLSLRIEKQAVNVNLAGRQRMLTQRLTKDLLILSTSEERDYAERRELMRDVVHTRNLFDTTLQSFALGGTTNDAIGRPVKIARLSRSAQPLIEQAQGIWQSLTILLDAYIDARQRSSFKDQQKILAPLLDFTLENNMKLLSVMNQLTQELEQETQVEARTIRTFQLVAFSLSIICFLTVLLIYLGRLRTTRRELDLIDSIIDQIQFGVMVVNRQGNIIHANHSMARLLSGSIKQVVGTHISSVLDFRSQDEESLKALRFDGTRFDAQVQVEHVQMDGIPASIYTVTDITEQRRQYDALSSLAYYDQLTGIPNRVFFEDRLGLELRQASINSTKLAVLFIDMDDFKHVNDSYGHDVGDLLLRQVALRLRRNIRSSDMASRRGGDEFTVMITHIEDVDTVRKVVSGLLEHLLRPYQCYDHKLDIGFSIGVAIFPRDATDQSKLICCADEAMYQAKTAGGSRAEFWHQSE